MDREAAQFQSVFLTQNSVAEARRAASALCCLVDCVLSRRDGSVSDEDEDIVNGMYDADYGFAIIRPPGHHAEPGLAGGFCLINNVAVAASFALRRHLTQTSRSDANVVQKVLIVDWDVHHGNGTQSIFWTDPSVLYFSVHVFLTGIFYPGTGRADAVGAGAGLGRTVNVAWSCQGMGDAEYLAVWERLLLPMACEFHPDLVLISAGFDAAAGDIGNCHLTANGFASLTRRLKQTLCQASRTKSSSSSSTSLHPAPMVCALEGGYVNSRLGQCVSAVVEAMLQKIDDNTLVIDDDSLFLSDQSTNSLLDCDIHPVARRNIEQTMESQRPFWNFLSDNG